MKEAELKWIEIQRKSHN